MRLGKLISGVLVVLFCTGTAASAAQDGRLRIATWNLSNLHQDAGQSVPGRDVARTQEDYTWLRYYARQLDADIVAIQEMHSRAAAHKLFWRGGWTVHISGRRLEDFDTYDLTGEWPDGSIYTGFAVRKSVETVSVRDLEAIAVDHVDPEDGIARSTRWAVELTVKAGGVDLKLLAVHLKSGCASGALRSDAQGFETFINPDDADCTTLARQVKPLRTWIDAQIAEGTPFIILGDFNRAFDRQDEDDPLWQGMTEGLAGGATLTRFPDGMEATCWKNAPPASYYRDPIDFLVFDSRAARMADRRSFGWLTYEPSLAPRASRISDHCPASIEIDPTRR